MSGNAAPVTVLLDAYQDLAAVAPGVYEPIAAVIGEKISSSGFLQRMKP